MYCKNTTKLFARIKIWVPIIYDSFIIFKKPRVNVVSLIPDMHDIYMIFGGLKINNIIISALL